MDTTTDRNDQQSGHTATLTTRHNASQLIRDASALYKVDTDAIALKVKQEFAAKEKARSINKSGTKPTPTGLKKSA